MARTLQSSLIISLLDKVTSPARTVAKSISGIGQAVRAANRGGIAAMAERNNAALGAMHGRLLGATAAAYGLARGIASPIGSAMKFESAMSDVRKVVDFDTPDQFKQMGDDIRALSKSMPMTATQIAEIVAAGGQAGVATRDLLTFSQGVVKVGIAWDTAAGATGQALAEMMSGMQMTVPQVMQLADQINFLSNKTAASAPKILDFMTRAGPYGRQFGMAAKEVAALGTAMISAGYAPDVAATSIRNLGNALTKGTAATKAQRAAWRELGTNAVDVAKWTQKYGGAQVLQAVFTRIEKTIPKERQAAFMSALFGDEARGAAAYLGSTLLRDTLRLIADDTQSAGSAQKEYESRLKTSANALQLFRNEVDDLNRSLGFALLPSFDKLLEVVKPFVVDLNAWAQTNPRLVAGVAKAASGVVGFRLATLGLGYAWRLLIKGSLLTILKPLATITKAFGTVASGGLLAMLRPMRLVTRGLGILRGALMLSGIGALLIAIGAAGKFIADNWSGIGVFFREFSASLTEALGGDGEKLKPILSTLKGFGEWMAGGSWKIDDSTWAEWGQTLGKDVAPAVERILEIVNAVMRSIGEADVVWNNSVFGGGKKARAAAAPPEPLPGELGTGSPLVHTGTVTGEVAAPSPQKASFWDRFQAPKFDGPWDLFGQMLQSTLKNEIPAIMRGAKFFQPMFDADYLTAAGDGRRARRQEGLAQISETPAWIGERIKALRELTASVPPSDAWLFNRIASGEGKAAETERSIVEGKANVQRFLDSIMESVRGMAGLTTQPASGKGATIPERSPEPPRGDGVMGQSAVDQLNQTVGPDVDLSGLSAYERAVDRLQGKLDKINRTTISPAFGGDSLSAAGGGSVRRTVRGEFSDAGL